MEVIDRLPRVTSGVRHDSIASLDDSRLSSDFNRGANQSSRQIRVRLDGIIQ